MEHVGRDSGPRTGGDTGQHATRTAGRPCALRRHARQQREQQHDGVNERRVSGSLTSMTDVIVTPPPIHPGEHSRYTDHGAGPAPPRKVGAQCSNVGCAKSVAHPATLLVRQHESPTWGTGGFRTA
jgi:hypothetical protein